MTEPNRLGKEGEEEARNYLIRQGYAIYHSNWRWKHYELDIVASKNNELVVVEVKTRSADYLLYPEEAVDKEKIKRIVAAANVYVRTFRLDMPVRFDIITLIKTGGDYEIEHIEDAFYAPLQAVK
jgi:putative endonuclease